MDNLQIFKEKQINDYLSSIDLTDLDSNQMKQELKNKLGEEPAIKFNYRKDEMIKENTGEKVKVDVMESVTIVFTIDREIAPGHTLPFPVTKTFIIG